MTLAQEYLERGNLSPAFLSYVNETMAAKRKWTHDFIVSLLRLPSTATEAEQSTAERYVFENDPIAIMDRLVKSGSIDGKTVLDVVSFPTRSFWIEFTSSETGTKFGFAVSTRINNFSGVFGGRKLVNVIAIAASTPTAVGPCGLISSDADDVRSIHLHWFKNSNGLTMSPKEVEAGRAFYVDLADCLFLINIPRACEFRPSGFGPRKAKVQERTGKPFVEFKRVVVRIGSAKPRYERSGAQGGIGTPESGKKYHRVDEYLRTYRKDREKPHVVLVEEHWRGNPELGIILREKVLRAPVGPPGSLPTGDPE